MKKQLLFLFQFIFCLSIIAQVSKVKEINLNGDSSPSHFIVYNNELYFYATDATGSSLYKTDGTENGTVKVTEATTKPAPMVIFDSNLMFYKEPASRPTGFPNVPGLITSLDGSDNSIDDQFYINPNGLNSYHSMFVLTNSSGQQMLSFGQIDGFGTPNLYNKVEENNIVNPLPSIVTNTWHNGIDNFQNSGVAIGTNSTYTYAILFKGNPTFNVNIEPYVYYGGSIFNTMANSDINVGNASSNPENLYYSDFLGLVFFSADNGVGGSNREVYFTDENMVVNIYDINPNGSSNPNNFNYFNNTIFFTADDGTSGNELYKGGNDPNTGQPIPILVYDGIVGSASSNPEHFFVYDGKLFFSAESANNGRELLSIDENDNVTSFNINPAGGSFPENFTIYNNNLYFTANNGSGVELFTLDPNSGNPVMVTEIDTHPVIGSEPKNLFVWNGDLYFSARENSNDGFELWKYSETTLSDENIEFSLNDISLFPNPIISEFNITGLSQSANVTIYDILGKKAFRAEDYLDQTINIKDFKSGLYLVKIDNKTGSRTLKLLIE